MCIGWFAVRWPDLTAPKPNHRHRSSHDRLISYPSIVVVHLAMMPWIPITVRIRPILPMSILLHSLAPSRHVLRFPSTLPFLVGSTCASYMRHDAVTHLPLVRSFHSFIHTDVQYVRYCTVRTLVDDLSVLRTGLCVASVPRGRGNRYNVDT
jgi:hypothetical protein